MSTIQSRLMQPLDDAAELIELFETVFGHTVTPHMWSWKYLPPWTLRHYCWVGLSDEKVVGYVGAVPLRGIVHGREAPFFQLADIMVLPDYRLKHDYFGLGTQAIMEDIGRSHPEHLLYGFSNHRAFRWLERIGLSGLIEKAHDRFVEGADEGQPSAYELHDWEWSEPRIDVVWKDLGSTVEVGLIRDGHYLRWRYGEHPVNRYRLVGIHRGGAAVGWAVVLESGLGRPGGPAEAPVVDVLLPEREIRPALQALSEHLEHPLKLWLPLHVAPDLPPGKDSGTHVYHFVRNSIASTEQLQRKLYYTMGDVDWW